MSAAEVQVLVLAKVPLPGRVKTRLCPPLTLVQAAAVAGAALADTLDAVRRARAVRRVLVLDGDPAQAQVDTTSFEVLQQRGGALDERLAAAFSDASCGSRLPTILVGMDTPQVTTALLEAAAGDLLQTDAVLGPACDGGWWALGLRRPDPTLLLGVATSRTDTGRQQHRRLRSAGLRVRELPVLRDVDTVADARAVARLAPASRFARAVGSTAGPAS